MLDAIAAVSSKVSNILNKVFKPRVMDQHEIADALADSMEAHQNLITVLTALTDKECKTWYTDTVAPQLKNDKAGISKILQKYQAGLRGKAQSEERKRFLGSMVLASKGWITLFTDVQAHLSRFLDGKKLDLNNIRLSQVALLSLIKQADMTLNFTVYLWDYLTRLKSRSSSSIPGYRVNFLKNHVEKVITLVNELDDHKGIALFVEDVDYMKKSQADLVVSNAQAAANATGSNYSTAMTRNFMDSMPSLNIFAALAQVWDNFWMWRYNRNKEMREWMATHVALLRLDLANTDPTSPEYARLQAIIQAYDDKITEYDQKIMEYEKENS